MITAKKLLKNKKGAISGIISSFGSAIQTFFSWIPRPVTFLFFLLTMLLLGNALTFLFTSTGIYCNSANEPVSIGFNLLQNFDLVNEIPDPDDIGVAQLEVGGGGVEACSQFFESGTYVLDDGTKVNFTDQHFYNGKTCTDCVTVDVIPADGSFLDLGELCLGAVTRKPDSEKNVFRRFQCRDDGGLFGACEPPTNYRYDPNVDKYVCDAATCDDLTQADIWDQKLQEADGKLLYPTTGTTGTGINSFVGVTCREIRPRLSVFNIEVFNYTYWIILMILAMFIWAIVTFKLLD